MARTLTEQEQQTLQRLRDRLLNALSSEERNYAAGIASSLVRIREPEITEADLERILEKYDAPKDSLLQAIKTQLLKPINGKKGAYALRKKDAKALPAADDQKSSKDDNTAEEAPNAGGRKPRRRTRKKTEGAKDKDAEVAPEAEPTNAEQAESDAAPSPETDLRPGRSNRKHTATTPDENASDEESVAPSESTESESDSPTNDTTDNDATDNDAVVASENDEPSDTSKDPEPAPVSETSTDDSSDEKTDSANEAEEPESDAAPSSEPAAEEQPSRSKNGHGHNGKKRKNERDPRRIPYVRRGDEDDTAIRQKIIGLDPRFWMNGWLLSHPGAYTMFERELNAMSEALADGDVLPGDITRRQMAYQMGGDEKFFEYGADGFRLLRAMGLEGIIRHRPLPKIDLVYHAPRRRKRMRVLVTENLDPYLDVHDLMYEDGRSLFLGERIHAVVLGGGTPILEHNRLSLLLDTLGADHIDVLYWGDIDRAGLELMCKLKDILGDKYGFEPFTPAYRLMVQKAMERFSDPTDNELTSQDNVDLYDIDFLTQGLADEEAAYARAVIEDCRLIPQEILTKRDL